MSKREIPFDMWEQDRERHENAKKALLEKIALLEEQVSNLLYGDEHRKPGQEHVVHAMCWQRDCDRVEGTTARAFKTWKEFYLWRDEEYDNAEGPCNVWEVTKEEHDAHHEWRREEAEAWAAKINR